jgi:hypothetical protein
LEMEISDYSDQTRFYALNFYLSLIF